MTVQELIDELKKLSPEEKQYEVATEESNGDDHYPSDPIEIHKPFVHLTL